MDKRVLNEIGKWNPPVWHPDYGDSHEKLAILKAYCRQIALMGNGIDFKLDCFEEGYMRAVGYKREKEIFELYALNGEEYQVAVFFTDSGKEVYLSSIEELRGVFDLDSP